MSPIVIIRTTLHLQFYFGKYETDSRLFTGVQKNIDFVLFNFNKIIIRLKSSFRDIDRFSITLVLFTLKFIKMIN